MKLIQEKVIIITNIKSVEVNNDEDIKRHIQTNMHLVNDTDVDVKRSPTKYKVVDDSQVKVTKEQDDYYIIQAEGNEFYANSEAAAEYVKRAILKSFTKEVHLA